MRFAWSVIMLAGALLMLASLPLGADSGRYITPRQADGLRIHSIEFTYPRSRALKSRELRSAMRIQEGARFRYRYFRGDLASVVALYRARGYREAQITRKQLLLDRRGRLILRLELDSGPRWHVSAVRIQGGAPFDSTLLLDQVRVHAGDPLDYGRVLQDERDLQIFLNRRGYAQATVNDEWVDDSRTHTAQVIYHVDPGRRMYFGRVTLLDAGKLKTRPSLIRRYLTFRSGGLFDPQELARSRQQLARTNLFRSVFFTTPEIATGDSLQPIEVRVQERKYIQVSANAYARFSAAELKRRMSASIVDDNWLGRGNRLGTDLSVGQPLQGASVYFMERNLFFSGADLVLSVGLTEEWGTTQVRADPDDRRQYDLLVANDSVLEHLLAAAGADAAREYIRSVVYDYTSIQRVLELSGTLTRGWGRLYQARVTVDCKRARTYPDPRGTLGYTPGAGAAHTGSVISPSDGAAPQAAASPSTARGLSTGTPWSIVHASSAAQAAHDQQLFTARRSSAARLSSTARPSSTARAARDQESSGLHETVGGDAVMNAVIDPGSVDYSRGGIPVDDTWKRILTDRSSSINLTTEFVRDSRDDRIAPTRGTFLRVSGLSAIKLGSHTTQVLDGEAEARHYQRLAAHWVLAAAGQYTQTASLPSDRLLPQVYWKRYGGEGSLRGVERADITAVGGGRTGINLRAELRFQSGRVGLVGFLDRAQVWRHADQMRISDLVRPSGMVDGYGMGLRYIMGFPFRLDVAFNDGFDKKQRMRIYFSIGQAF